MGRENRMQKRRNRFHKWCAILLALLLAAGQSHIPALAQEEPVSQEAGSFEEDDIIQDNNIDINDEQSECVCKIKCTVENIDTDCAICLADYTVCAGIAENGEGGELYSTTKIDVVETVSENEIEQREEDILLIADGAGEADATDIWIDYVKYSIKEQSGDIREVQVSGYEEGIASELVIPNKITFNGTEWDVVEIGSSAFRECEELVRVNIPGSVRMVRNHAFDGCLNLNKVYIADGMQEIGKWVFARCHNLESIEIPDSVMEMDMAALGPCLKLKTVKLPNKLSKISMCLFQLNRCLEEVYIPESVNDIEDCAFAWCTALHSVDIPKSVRKMHCHAFYEASYLTYMKIAIDTDRNQTVIPIENYSDMSELAFDGCPDERYLIFMNEDGTKRLTGEAYERAKTAYLGDISDGDVNDNKWHGWQIEEPPAEVDKYTVTIHVQKDDKEWIDHGKKFALRKNDGAEFITDLTQVENGTYNIYDITGVNPDSYWSKSVDTGIDVRVDGVDTEVTVTVLDDDTEATVNYYTATFYDGADAYGTDTSQAPQVILNGQKVTEPDAPNKAGQQFVGWKTQDGGSIPFGFNTAVTTVTNIYASWTAMSETFYTITARAGAGGRINPEGSVNVKEGAAQNFVITPDDGYMIKAVTVDGIDLTDAVMEADGIYTFDDVRQNHTIEADFEMDGNKPDGGNTPGDGEDIPGGGDNPGGSETDGGSGSSGEDSGGGDSSSDTGVSDISNPPDNKLTATGFVDATDSGSKEPKTGDTYHEEIYATIAMIAGLTYLFLYFTDKERGMTEEEKKELVSMLIRWAKQGHRLRKYIVMAAVFCLLVYYHSIGKRICITGRTLSLQELQN